MRRPKKDPQQYRAYKWEDQLIGWLQPSLTATTIKRLIARCCRMYKVPVPDVKLVTKDRRHGKKLASEWNPNTGTITIRPRHRDPWTATHEAAHAITDWLFGLHTGVQAHGKEWLGIYMVLLTRLKGAPRSALMAHARTLGLRYCPLSAVRPEVVRARYAARFRRAQRERRAIRMWERG